MSYKNSTKYINNIASQNLVSLFFFSLNMHMLNGFLTFTCGSRSMLSTKNEMNLTF